MDREPGKYDAVIIGAGIGGLVCGCYLAKAGMKVLIAERHSKPGGYCTSFRRKEFFFDAAAHSFGGCRDGGLVRRVFRELGIEARLGIVRHDPTDVILSPRGRIGFRTAKEGTITEFGAAFPGEAGNLLNFINYIENPPPAAFVGARRRTFQDLLDEFIGDRELKALLAYPLLGNCGLPPARLSAFIGTKVFQEFLLDGGYYPARGMQSLPDTLADRFREWGGELRLRCEASQILLEGRSVAGVLLQDGSLARTGTVVSNGDAHNTFTHLLGQELLPRRFLTDLSRLVPSLSMVVLYLGVDPAIQGLPGPGVNLWHLPHYDLESLYAKARAGHADSVFMLRVVPDSRSVLAFAQAAFGARDFWQSSKKTVLERYIERIDASILPGFSKHLLHREAATPSTLYRYTLNREGAAFGWEATPVQLATPGLRHPSFLEGLYLTGHWTSQGLGIPGVIYAGYDAAKLILRCEKRRQIC